MASSRLRRLVACAAVAAVGLPGSDAGAVVYSSVFDPPNFRGTATFDVAQACLNVGTGFAFPGAGGCTVTWLSATVTFQDAPGLTFDYTAFLPDSGFVNSIWVEEGDLAGVNSDAIGPVIIAGSSNELFNAPWWIQYMFLPPSPGFTALDGPPSSGEFGLGVVYMYSGICSRIEPVCERNPNPVETANVLSFTRVTQVPESGTLALTLAAVAGAWFTRRRKTSAA